MPTPRFPDVPKDRLTKAQKRVYDAIAGARAAACAVPSRSSCAARSSRISFRSSAKYEWYAHRPLALKGGLAESIADDVARGARPAGMKDDEAVVFDFCSVLHRQHFVDDALFKRAVDALGEQGVVDLIGVSGYYTLVSMVLNVAEVPRPPGAASPW